jgi:hypothetical protein
MVDAITPVSRGALTEMLPSEILFEIFKWQPDMVLSREIASELP